jgi:hypothetical protein
MASPRVCLCEYYSLLEFCFKAEQLMQCRLCETDVKLDSLLDTRTRALVALVLLACAHTRPHKETTGLTTPLFVDAVVVLQVRGVLREVLSDILTAAPIVVKTSTLVSEECCPVDAASLRSTSGRLAVHAQASV